MGTNRPHWTNLSSLRFAIDSPFQNLRLREESQTPLLIWSSPQVHHSQHPWAFLSFSMRFSFNIKVKICRVLKSLRQEISCVPLQEFETNLGKIRFPSQQQVKIPTFQKMLLYFYVFVWFGGRHLQVIAVRE